MKKHFLLFILFYIPSSFAAFSETNSRYLSSRDFLNLMEQKFSVLTLQNNPEFKVKNNCWTINQQNKNFLGTTRPATGKPSITQPTANLVTWLIDCLDNISLAQFKYLSTLSKENPLWSKYFAKELLELKSDRSLIFSQKWLDLTPQIQDQVLKHAIEEMLGPDALLREWGFLQGAADIIKILRQEPFAKNKDDSIAEVTRKAYIALGLRDEFYKY